MSDGDNGHVMFYRAEGQLPEEPDSVSITREEYAHLRRANHLFDAVENRCEDIRLTSYSRRRPWEVTLVNDNDELVEGVGKTFKEAMEDALDLGPVTPWRAAPPRQIPWVRLMLLGAALGQALLWGLR